ncbi:MAG: heme o synthase [Gammaproteobacteria bacterium]
MTSKASTVNNNFVAQWRDYLELCKPRVVALMVFTALVGMLIAAPGNVPFDALIFGLLGITLMAGSAAAINHLVDRNADALMRRTRNRPLPSGQLDARSCLIFAFTIGTAGMLLLILFVNTLTAVLTLVSLVGYAVIYTMFLKRATPQNIVIGGAAGAMPPMLGWTAVTGQVDPGALLLFLIIFTWTPPHFWALALYRKEEYAKTGIPMLPLTHGDDYTRLQIALYAVLLVVVSVLPFVTGMSGVVYLAGVLVLDAIFLFYVVMLFVSRQRKWAIKTFFYSIVYLTILFAILLFDRYLPLAMT